MKNFSETFTKLLITTLVVGFIAYAMYASWLAGMHNWFAHASFGTIILAVVGLVAITALLIHLLVKMWRHPLMILLISAAVMQSCNYAKSNQQIVISRDCGSNWEQIKSGESVPIGTGNYCFMKVVMPNYPMQGESKFVANLQGKVKVKAEIDYDYQIVNALAFIPNAKYLGAANADADSNGALDQKSFEAAENTVIEKRIRDVAKRLFAAEDIVDVDPTELEQRLLDESNKTLKSLGIELNFITLTFIPDEQTNQAIDVATAIRIYESKGLSELGNKIIQAKAGAAKIEVQQKVQNEEAAN